jgi:hypothetical protein
MVRIPTGQGRIQIIVTAPEPSSHAADDHETPARLL